MKILFLTRLYKPHVGGIEKHVYEVSRLLKEKGHKIIIVTTKYDENLKESETLDGIKVYRFNQPNIKLIGLLYTWFWFLKSISLIKQSDVVHIHDVFAWYLSFNLLLNNKFYITYHGRWGQYPIPKRDVYQKRLGAKLAEDVLCIGNYIPKNYGFECKRIIYGAVKPIKSVKKDEKLVVYVGRLDNDTSLTTYLEVFKRIKGYRVIFCGDGELKEECAKYGKVLGWTKDPTTYFAKAKYVFASGYLTILEALSAKCLVFAAYDSPLKKDYYLDTPFKDYIVAGNNSKKLYERFNYYEKNKKDLENKVNNGYEYANEQTWEKMTDMYLNMWKENS